MKATPIMRWWLGPSFALASLCSCQEHTRPEPSANEPAEWLDEEVPESTSGSRGLRKELGGTNGDFDYCNGSVTCSSGEGDCDRDSECTPGMGLVCGRDNGPNFLMPIGWDVCVPAHCTNMAHDADEDLGRVDCGGSCGACVCNGTPGTATFCSPSCPCPSGQGDCDRNADCQAGLICGKNNGAAFGLPSDYDVCIASASDAGVNDATTLPDAAVPSDSGAPADSGAVLDSGVDAGVAADSGVVDAGGGDATTIERASISTAGAQGDGLSQWPAISADGNIVAFESGATTLVPNDLNGVEDVFVRDRQGGTTARVSVSSAGIEADGISGRPAISGDGRFVAFQSMATNLVLGDTNGTTDVFVHDRQTGVTSRVSVSSTGSEGNDESFQPALSADGRFVAFRSRATTLVPGDTTSGFDDAFVHDLQTGVTTRVSVATNGTESNDEVFWVAISADGHFVAFDSLATNLVAGDANGVRDVFVHDTQTGTTERVSVSTSGTEGNSTSDLVGNGISADGRFVVFGSDASNLVLADSNNATDVFVRDRLMSTTSRASLTWLGQEGNGLSDAGSISADGRFVVFVSGATNLIVGDTNGFSDVYARDLQTGDVLRLNIADDGTQSNAPGQDPLAISADGRFATFLTVASDLVPGDTNLQGDVFVARNALAP